MKKTIGPENVMITVTASTVFLTLFKENRIKSREQHNLSRQHRNYTRWYIKDKPKTNEHNKKGTDVPVGI